LEECENDEGRGVSGGGGGAGGMGYVRRGGKSGGGIGRGVKGRRRKWGDVWEGKRGVWWKGWRGQKRSGERIGGRRGGDDEVGKEGQYLGTGGVGGGNEK